jgi:hypothetical protein
VSGVIPGRRGFAVGARRAQLERTVADRVSGEVISLASRRRAVVVAPARPVEPARPAGRRPILALFTGVVVLVLALAAGMRSRNAADLRALSPGDRGRIFARSLDDLKTACADPAGGDGALRDHCRAQSQFLTLFPECDRTCRSLAATWMPHARR